MNLLLRGIRDRVRFVIIVLSITMLYLLLIYVNQSIFDTFYYGGLFDTQERWAEEARDVAARSAESERRLSAAHQFGIWRLGFLLGYASEMLGSSTRLGPDAQMAARAATAERLRQSEAIAEAFGLGSVQVLQMRTLEDLNRLPDRIEADEIGLAARIESRLSARHKHLFLLGMHVGTELCRAVATQGEALTPDRTRIGRNATLAGIPLELWRPLAEVPAGLDSAGRVARYRAAVDAMEAQLAARTVW